MTNTAAVEAYRLARQAQDERFDSRPGAGAVDHTMTWTEEYQAYFGLGEYAGSAVEARVTYRDTLRQLAAERRASLAADPIEAVEAVEAVALITSESAFYMSGADLAEIAAAGCPVAAAEIERRAARRAAKRAAKLASAA